MDTTDPFSIFESRKKFWDDFEKKYATKQAYENCDYGVLEFDKYWPDASPTQNLNTKDNHCKQRTSEDEAMYDGSSVLSSLDGLCDQENNGYGANVDSNLQNIEQQRRKSESTHVRECRSPITDKLLNITNDVRVNCDIQISKTAVECHKQINIIAVKRFSKVQRTQICRTEHTVPTNVHDNLAFDVPIAAQNKSDKTAGKIQCNSEGIKSELQNKNQHQVYTDIRGGLNLPSSNIEPTPSGAIKASEKACDVDCSKLKHSRENNDGILRHKMENAITFGGAVAAETPEVQNRDTRSQSKLRKQDSVNTNCSKNACIPSISKNIPLVEVQRKSFKESFKAKDNLDTVRESCNSPSISGNKENYVINEKRPNNSAKHKSKDIDSSSLTSTTSNSSKHEDEVPNMKQIHETCTEKEHNKASQSNSITKHSRENNDGILGHKMENAITFGGAVCSETPEVQKRHTISQSKLRKQDSISTKNTNCSKNACIPSISKNIPLVEVHRKSFKESFKAKDNLDAVRESYNSPSISGNKENYVLNKERPNNSAKHKSKDIDSSSLTSITSNSSKHEDEVSNMKQIHETCTEKEHNKAPQSNRITDVSTVCIGTLNDAVQTRKSHTEAAVCASVAKSASSNILYFHQTSSKGSTVVENDNDLHVIHQSDTVEKADARLSVKKDTNAHSLTKHSSPNLLQRNEKEANSTNFKDKAATKHKAFMALLHSNTTTSSKGFYSTNNTKTFEKESSPFNVQFTEKSLVDGKEKVHLQNKMDQSTETSVEKRCRNNCLAKQRVEGDYTYYNTRDVIANVTEDVLEKLSIRSRKRLRKRFSRLVEKVLNCKTERQVLSHSLSKNRNFTATEEQNCFTDKNEKLDEINNGEFRTSLNQQCTDKLVTAEDDPRVSSQRQTENTKKRKANDESNSRDAKDSISDGLTALDSNAYSGGDHSIEAKQSEYCISERYSERKLISQPCLSNYGENCLQTELSHSIKTANVRHNTAATFFKLNDTCLAKTSKEEKSAINNDDMEQFCENVSEKYTNCLRNGSPENNRSDHGQQNKGGIIQAPLTDSLLKTNNSAIKFKSKKLDICRSKAEFCESNEINSKCSSNILAETECTVSQSKHQYTEIQRPEEHKATKNGAVTELVVSKSNIYCESNCSEKQTKPSAFEITNVQNKEKPSSYPLLQVPCPPNSRKRCTTNDNEAHNSCENLTNGSAFNSSITQQLQHELCEQNSLRNKSSGKMRRKLGILNDKQNKGDVKEDSMKQPSAPKAHNFSAPEKQKFTTTELEYADRNLKEMNGHKINYSGMLCTQGTLSESKHEENRVQINIKRRKLFNIPHTKDAKDYAKINLTILESSVCNDSDYNNIQQQPNKYFASGSAHTQSRASKKPLSQLNSCAPVVNVECKSNLSFSDCIASKMLTNCSTGSWTTFKTRIVNDLQVPLPKAHKLCLLYRN